MCIRDSTWFAPRLTGKGAFTDVYSVMANMGANHGAFTYGHIGADILTLASMPVSYTHLDVYKRQALSCARTSSQGTSSSIILSIACTCPIIFLRRRCKVSEFIHCFMAAFPDAAEGYSYYQVIRQTGNAVKNRVLPRQEMCIRDSIRAQHCSLNRTLAGEGRRRFRRDSIS